MLLPVEASGDSAALKNPSTPAVAEEAAVLTGVPDPEPVEPVVRVEPVEPVVPIEPHDPPPPPSTATALPQTVAGALTGAFAALPPLAVPAPPEDRSGQPDDA